MKNRTHTHERLSKQVKLVQTELDRLREMVGEFDPATPPQGISAGWINGILDARRRRENIFGERIFSDPGWDILLAAYALQLGKQRGTITDVSRLSGVPGTTVLRWIKQLEGIGLLTQKDDEDDGRLVLLELSARGIAAMTQYFEGPQPTGLGL